VNRREIAASISVLLAGLICCAAAVAQKRSQREEAGLVGPVRTVRVYGAEVFVKDGKTVESPRMLSATMVFDEAGRLLESADYSPGGATGTKSTWKYDDAGREIEHCSYVHDDLVDRYVSTYDEKGRIRERSTYGTGGRLDRKVVYQFNETGTQARLTEHRDGEVRGSADETYDGQGRLVERNVLGPASSRRKVLYTYDAAGNKTSEIHEDISDGRRHHNKTVYVYGEDGRLREESSYQDAALSSRKTYRYDNRGNPIRTIEYNAGGEIEDEASVAYEYASDGNWTKATITHSPADTNKSSPRGYIVYRRVTFTGDKSVELLLAATKGDPSGVKAALEQGVNAEVKDGDGRTATMLASREGHAAIVQLLLSRGAQVEAKDVEGRTALMWAAESGRIDVVKLLLSSGADVDARNDAQGTALMPTALANHIEIVRLLISKGADVNAKASDGSTALLMVAGLGEADMARFLIQNGADVNAKTRSGVTPLIYAAARGNLAVAKALLENGADSSVKTEDGKTAIDAATDMRHEEMIKLLQNTKTVK
jgi:ankyrin repeat protein/antitoxin component YwqK of YwqJK toxin-antitoxin module